MMTMNYGWKTLLIALASAATRSACTAFTSQELTIQPPRRYYSSSSSVCARSMAARNLIDAANFAVQQSPASTRFITNKMCPFAQKVWIALEVAKTPYELEEISLYGPGGKPDWFWELNPDGTVPVLVCHGGAAVYPDSDLALDAVGDGNALGEQQVSLTANDEKTDQLVREWRKMINNMLPVGKKAVMSGGSKQKLMEVLKHMNDKVQSPYLCGDKVTVADCAAFPFMWRLNDEFGLNGLENLQAWLTTCEQNESFSKTIQSAWWWWW